MGRAASTAGGQGVQLASWGSTKATVAGASKSQWLEGDTCGAGAAGMGCESGAELFRQQQVLPQWPHEQAGRSAAGGAT